MNAIVGDVFVGGLGLIAVLLLIVFAILWSILPSAIFGTKRRLDRQTELLEMLTQAVREQSAILLRIEALARVDDEEMASEKAEEEPEPVQDARTEPRIIPRRSTYER